MAFFPGSLGSGYVGGINTTSIQSGNLIGNFDSTQSIATTHWGNQVTNGKHLRRYNNIVHDNTDPDKWLFDGADDYLGKAATNYGGDPFAFNPASAWAMGQWVRYNNNDHHLLWLSDVSISTDPKPAYGSWLKFSIMASSDQAVLTINTNPSSDSDETQTTTFSNFTFSNTGAKWYYVGLTYNGSNSGWRYHFTVNGIEYGRSTIQKCKNATAYPEIGAVLIGGGGSAWVPSYTSGSSTTKIGHVHFYNTNAGRSTFWRNYMATHKSNTARWYGASFTAT